MFPTRYIEEVENSRKKNRLYTGLIISSILLSCMYLVGPLLHELSHIIWLEFNSCFYTVDLGFNFLTGIYGEVNPLCYVSDADNKIFLTVGYLSTSLLGVTSLIAGDFTERFDSYAFSAGIGLLLSVLITLNIKGDVFLILKAFDVAENLHVFIYGFLTVSLLSTSLKGTEMLIESLEREE